MNLLKEPTVHFVAAGLGIFALHAALAPAPVEPAPDAEVIEISAALATTLEAEGEGGTHAWVRDEVLFREALRIGLDDGDVIIRRRLVQKMEFLLRGLVDVEEPSDDELQAFMREHANEYGELERVALVHIFFSRESRGRRAEADAVDALPLVRSTDTDPATVGDPFSRPREVGPVNHGTLMLRLGPAIADAAFGAEPGTWLGPLRSHWGMHLVRVTERFPAEEPRLAALRDRLRRDWLTARRDAAYDEAVRELVESYPVQVAEVR